MIKSCDVGSLPCKNEFKKLSDGASNFATNINNNSARLFEKLVVDAFLDKLNAGIAVPALPQFRDMNEMFLSTFEGLQKTRGGYIERARLTLKPAYCRLPEVAALKRNDRNIHAQIGTPFQLRVCITGPYTLASMFPYKNNQTCRNLGQVLSETVEKNVFVTKHGKAVLISIDEPLFGLIDDPLIDKGTEGRENLLTAWESITVAAKKKNVETSMHLHCTSDDLFWAVKSLGIVESHVDDPIYKMKATKQRLESEDKLLTASIAISDFDRLIREKMSLDISDNAVADAWKDISKNRVNPEIYLEDIGVMKKRLMNIVTRFGIERVALAGTECGLRGFPTYQSAIKCLERLSDAVKSSKK